MVLGANGSIPTETDENTPIEKMYNLMKAGGVLANDTTLEQAYPTLRSIITADSARRQNLAADQEMIGPAGMIVEVQPTHDDVNLPDNANKEFDLDTMGDSIEITSPHKMIEGQTANKPSQGKLKHNEGLVTPLGIEVYEDSRSLARRLDLSAVATEKLLNSAKAFSRIRPTDDITLTEQELVTLDKTSRAMAPIHSDIDDCTRVSRGTIPPGSVSRRHSRAESGPDDIGEGTDRNSVEQFLRKTSHLSADDRIKLLTEVSGEETRMNGVYVVRAMGSTE